MTVRATLGRCLMVLAAMGLVGQALALSTHAPVEIVASTAGDEDGDHDPGSCDLCQVLSQVRMQVSPPTPESGRLSALSFAAHSSWLDRSACGVELAAASPRAPPSA